MKRSLILNIIIRIEDLFIVINYVYRFDALVWIYSAAASFMIVSE